MIRTLILVLFLVGCATNGPLPYGNQLNNPTAQALNHAIAADTVKKLVALYPPAGTTIGLKQATTDNYGGSLVGLLREKGYAILEYNPVTDERAKEAPNPTISLNYIIDQVPSMALYRATLFINGQPLSRVYTADKGVLQPAGSWVRKE
jgi:type IV secretion system protein TrbH